jgi:hypothetical protein
LIVTQIRNPLIFAVCVLGRIHEPHIFTVQKLIEWKTRTK